MLIRSDDRPRMVKRLDPINPLLNADPLVLAGLANATASGSGRLEFCGQCQLNLCLAARAERVEVLSLSHNSGPSP